MDRVIRVFVFFLCSVLVIKGALGIPVTQKLLRLQPLPKGFIDWPDSSRRQVLRAMDQAIVPSRGAHGDLRYLIGAGGITPAGNPLVAEGSEPTQGGEYPSLAPSSSAIPVTQKLFRLQPVPKSFLDWPESARRQVLRAMDQVITPSSDAYGDFRHLIDAGEMTPEANTSIGWKSDPTREDEDSLSSFSSSWSSMSTDENVPDDVEVGRMVYRHLYKYLSGDAWDISSSVVSEASLNSGDHASSAGDRARGAGNVMDHLPLAVRGPPRDLPGGGSDDYSYSTSYSDSGQSSSEEDMTEQPVTRA